MPLVAIKRLGFEALRRLGQPTVHGPLRFSFFQNVTTRPEGSFEDQPRRKEDREGRTEEIFVFFVSSWLILISHTPLTMIVKLGQESVTWRLAVSRLASFLSWTEAPAGSRLAGLRPNSMGVSPFRRPVGAASILP
jgi:hypothetical protein